MVWLFPLAHPDQLLCDVCLFCYCLRMVARTKHSTSNHCIFLCCVNLTACFNCFPDPILQFPQPWPAAVIEMSICRAPLGIGQAASFRILVSGSAHLALTPGPSIKNLEIIYVRFGYTPGWKPAPRRSRRFSSDAQGSPMSTPRSTPTRGAKRTTCQRPWTCCGTLSKRFGRLRRRTMATRSRRLRCSTTIGRPWTCANTNAPVRRRCGSRTNTRRSGSCQPRTARRASAGTGRPTKTKLPASGGATRRVVSSIFPVRLDSTGCFCFSIPPWREANVCLCRRQGGRTCLVCKCDLIKMFVWNDNQPSVLMQ